MKPKRGSRNQDGQTDGQPQRGSDVKDELTKHPLVVTSI
jgi:hypothetical protein